MLYLATTIAHWKSILLKTIVGYKRRHWAKENKHISHFNYIYQKKTQKVPFLKTLQNQKIFTLGNVDAMSCRETATPHHNRCH